jgi:hypothetical protein
MVGWVQIQYLVLLHQMAAVLGLELVALVVMVVLVVAVADARLMQVEPVCLGKVVMVELEQVRVLAVVAVNLRLVLMLQVIQAVTAALGLHPLSRVRL